MSKLDAPTERRPRAAICLGLFLLFSFGARDANSSHAANAAYLVGFYAPPALCLGLGTWFAFRDQRPIARVVASSLVGITLAAGLLGFLAA